MSEQPDQQPEAAKARASEASAPTAGKLAIRSGVVETVVMPVAQAAVGGVVTVAVGAVTERVTKKF